MIHMNYNKLLSNFCVERLCRQWDYQFIDKTGIRDFIEFPVSAFLSIMA